jgi:glyoxylase-like metal-dependent hydrolase (beta-lactamase superfamily II)
MKDENEIKYTVRQLADDLWTIEEERVRCFLIYDGAEALLIDACASGGMEFHDAVRSVIGNIPTSIVLTHADIDHMAGISKKGSPAIHPSDFDRYRKMRPRFDADDNLVALREGTVLSCGKRQLKVFHIPGHTPGSIAFLNPANRCIFVGDTISTSYVFMFGEGRSLEAYIDSLAWIETIANQFDSFYCSHGDCVVPIEQLYIQKEAAEKLLLGELVGTDPPFDVGADVKMYRYQNTTFLY